MIQLLIAAATHAAWPFVGPVGIVADALATAYWVVCR